MASTELEVYSTDADQVALAQPMTKRAAQALDKKIRAASDKLTSTTDTLWELLEQAAQGQIHEVLEYPSWVAWVKDAVQFTPSDRIERKELVKLMSGKGMSQRSIAGTLGVSQKTVDRDLEGVESEEGATVTTVSGKSYPKQKKQAEIIDAEIVDDPAEQPEERGPLSVADVSNEFRTEVDNVGIDIQALKDIMEYDEFPKAAKVISNRYLNKLGEYVSEMQKLIDQLTGV